MNRYQFKDKKQHGTLLFIVFIIYSLLVTPADAKQIYLPEGGSHIIKIQEEIDTVFVSAAKTADYEILDNNSVIIYAKKEGLAEFTLFNKSHQPIIKTTVLVNNIINDTYRKIRTEYPDSYIEISKIGESYILTGSAESEEAKDTIVQIVSEATAVKKENSGTENYQRSPDYQRIINKIKLPQANQVNVKLTIVEITKDFTENIGLDWSSINSAAGTFQFFKFNAKSISTLVHAINDEAIARVLAEPNLSVLSGESASFLVGGEIPIVSTNQNGATVEYKEFGIKLNIGAKVNEKKRIRVMLGEEVSSIDKIFNIRGGESYPSLRTRKANTTVELGDGESFILGGLISRSERESLKKIPFIGDIPLLGVFFRNAQTQQNQSELVVVATVNLVKPVPEKQIELPDFMHTSTIERFFNLTKIKEINRRKQAKDFLQKGGFIK